MNYNFDMDALRTMVVGVDLGTFSRAASQLGRSQSGVSMQLRKLEEQAGKQLFVRKGRGLVPTEAGDALLAYARRIISLNDEAAVSIGAMSATACVRMGLPQDFFEDVMPMTLTQFSRERPHVHVEVLAGRNYALEEKVNAGRLDAAIAFFPAGSKGHGKHMASLPMRWYGGEQSASPDDGRHALVVFDHPCLFRKAALQAMEKGGHRWRLSLTTPSLAGIWAAVRAGHGISVRTTHRVPDGVRDVGANLRLPKLPPIELRLLAAPNLSPAASDLHDVLCDLVPKLVNAKPKPGKNSSKSRSSQRVQSV